MVITGVAERARGWLVAAAAGGAVVLALAGCTPPGGPPDGEDDLARGAVGVQLFQWTWPAIAAECTDVLGPAGFDYVLTSPPQEHILGEPWWTAYQPVSYQVESRLGSRAEFAEMVATCEEAGVGIVADAVINHMTGQDSPGTGWVGSTFQHYEYPGLYSDADGDFHHCGLTGSDDIENYQNREQVQLCELLNLADLATETEGVREQIGAYLADLLSLGVAGFRIDAAKHMPAQDVKAITDALPAGTVVWSEVIRGAGEPIRPEEYVPAGQVFEFGFPTGLATAITTSTGSQFEGLATGAGLLDSADAVTFVDNHDTERNSTTLSYRADADYALANVFLLAVPYGLPVLYSGYAFGSLDGKETGPAQDAAGAVLDAGCPADAGPDADVPNQGWVCQHRWPPVVPMVEFRSAVAGEALTDWWDQGSALAFGRGDRGYVVINLGDEAIEGTWTTSLAPGEYCDVQTGALMDGACEGEVVSVAQDGTFTASVPAGAALTLHVDAVPGA
jgi:alpha-amylase